MCTKECLLSSVYDLRDMAWNQALKYRFDPVAGPMHEKYLNMLNEIIIHNEKEGETNE